MTNQNIEQTSIDLLFTVPVPSGDMEYDLLELQASYWFVIEENPELYSSIFRKMEESTMPDVFFRNQKLTRNKIKRLILHYKHRFLENYQRMLDTDDEEFVDSVIIALVGMAFTKALFANVGLSSHLFNPNLAVKQFLYGHVCRDEKYPDFSVRLIGYLPKNQQAIA